MRHILLIKINLVNPFCKMSCRVVSSAKAKHKVCHEQDTRDRYNKSSGIGEHTTISNDGEELEKHVIKEVIHNSYLVSFCFGLFLLWIIPYCFVFCQALFYILF